MFADMVERLHAKRRQANCLRWSKTAVPYAHLPEDFGVFFDWCSLLQCDPSTGERLPDERAAFEASFQDIELFFAHRLTTVLLLTKSSPPTRPDYHHNGWTVFESLVSGLLKKRRIDLWNPVIDVGEWRNQHNGPPLSLEAFTARVDGPHRNLLFNRPADKDIVVALYGSTLSRALSVAPALFYEARGWGTMELSALIRVLPLCSHLRVLSLMDNALGPKGVEMFARAVGTARGTRSMATMVLPALRDLDLSGNAIEEASLKGMAGGAHSLQALAWALSPVSMSDVEVNAGRQDLLSRPRPAGLPLLQELRMRTCEIKPRAFLLFCRALLPNALANLVKLHLQGNDRELRLAGVDPLVEALDVGAMPHLRTVVGVGGGALGAEISSLRDVKKMRNKLATIDWSKNDALKKIGTSETPPPNVIIFDKQIKDATARLERFRIKYRAAPVLHASNIKAL